jgi:putative nucleotidyltransferase with HDIG domain
MEKTQGMSNIVGEKDLAILLKAGLSEEDIRHSILVAEKAVDIARRTGKDLDLELIARGALFHDLGKAITHTYQHGEIGAEMGKRFGLPKAVTDIARKHFHGGNHRAGGGTPRSARCRLHAATPGRTHHSLCRLPHRHHHRGLFRPEGRPGGGAALRRNHHPLSRVRQRQADQRPLSRVSPRDRNADRGEPRERRCTWVS